MSRKLTEMTPAEAAMYLMSGAWERDHQTKRERKTKSNPRVEKDHEQMSQAQDAIKKVMATESAPAPAPTGFDIEFGKNNMVITPEGAAGPNKLSQVNAGLDPEIVQAGIGLSVYYIEGGARKFVEYARKMIADLGDAVKPYLKSWYSAVRFHPGFDTKGMDSLAELETIDLDKALAEPEPAGDVVGIFKDMTDPRETNLGSGPVFDDEIYRQAKPHLINMWNAAKAAASDVEEALSGFIDQVLDALGPIVGLHVVKPYIKRFYKDVKSGNINQDEEGATNDEETDRDDASGSGDVTDGRNGKKRPDGRI